VGFNSVKYTPLVSLHMVHTAELILPVPRSAANGGQDHHNPY